MYCSKGTLLVFLVAICSLALAEEEKTQKEEAADDRNSAAATTQQSGSAVESFIHSPGLIAALTQGGFVVAGLFAMAALAMLVVPTLSSTRFCHMFNNCDPSPYQAYSAQGNSLYGDYQGAYGNGGTYNNPTYPQKRSIEYIAPVLKAIGNAYDRYNLATGADAAKKVA